MCLGFFGVGMFGKKTLNIPWLKISRRFFRQKISDYFPEKNLGDYSGKISRKKNLVIFSEIFSSKKSRRMSRENISAEKLEFPGYSEGIFGNIPGKRFIIPGGISIPNIPVIPGITKFRNSGNYEIPKFRKFFRLFVTLIFFI